MERFSVVLYLYIHIQRTVFTYISQNSPTIYLNFFRILGIIFFGCGSLSGIRSRATLCPTASFFESWKRASSATEGLETTQPRRVKSFWVLYGRVSDGMVRMWERNSLLRGFEAKVLGKVIEIGREFVDGECDGAHMEMQIVRVPFVH